VLWVLQKGNVRSFDFTNPALVKETTLQLPADAGKVPEAILDALRGTVDVLDPPPASSAVPEAPKNVQKAKF
jgi:hypothetical protein